ncbi:MAG: hypothetical protein CMH64_02270 [Nanoarchaeota archaeon]|nr:hypothetical protein [Nanoarchaeota archaeon]|tara:strand:- start:1001 stop:2941 length:1941 start_codon:yes stop_codon:yes gene_type:complete
MKKLLIFIIFFLLPLAFAQDGTTDDITHNNEEFKDDFDANTDDRHEENFDEPLDDNPEEDFFEEDSHQDDLDDHNDEFFDDNPEDFIDDSHEDFDDAFPVFQDDLPIECEGLTDDECKAKFDSEEFRFEDENSEFREEFRLEDGEIEHREEFKDEFGEEETRTEFKDDGFREEHREEFELPDNCHLEESEFGSFVKCEEEKDFELDELERKCNEHGGNFHVGEFGPECIFEEQKQGFFQESQCNDDSILREDANRCQQDGGKPEKFIDDNNCPFVSCNYEEFDRKREERFEKIEDSKERFFRECEAKNGRPTILRGEPHCFTPEEKVRIKEDLKPLEPTDLLKIALKLENIVRSLTLVEDNFVELQKFYEDRDDNEKAASFERAISKIEGAKDRLDEIRNDIADKAGDITEQDRINVLRDIQHVKNIMQDIAIEILTGGKSSRLEKRGGDDFEKEEDDFMETIRNCEDFTQDNTFNFSPDPEFDVKIYGEDGNCVMTINSEMTGTIVYTMPPKVYQFFRGPEQLFDDSVECSPNDGCKRMRQMMEEDMREDDRDDDRRGNDDFNDRSGPDRGGSSAGPIPRHCDDNNLSPSECYEWTIENIGTPNFCRDMSDDECRTLTIEGWERDLNERVELDEAFEREFEEEEL